MKRKLQASAILTADWHLREDTPLCRTDDFWNAQWADVEFITQLQKRHNCPVLHSGDLFHKWKPAPYLITCTMKRLPAQFYTVYGNHDVPAKSFALKEKSGLAVLETAGACTALKTGHFGVDPDPLQLLHLGGKKVLVWHVLTWADKRPFPGCVVCSAKRILRAFDFVDLIVTGDNHETFTSQYQNRILVNPGSLNQQKADQMNFKPSVFLWYAATNTIERVFLPEHPNVITQAHLEEAKDNEQLQHLVQLLYTIDNNDAVTVGSDVFESMLEEYCNKNQEPTELLLAIREVVENAKEKK